MTVRLYQSPLGRRTTPITVVASLLFATICLHRTQAFAQSPTTPVPWPAGRPPTDQEISELLDDALSIERRENREEFLAAAEYGEESESLGIVQSDIDNNLYSLDLLFQFGDSFFSHEFSIYDGFGDGQSTAIRRVHTGIYGGRDTFSCRGCHSVGGIDGAGSETQNAFIEGDGISFSSANVRNAPPLQGLGVIQALASEMTQDLQQQRDQSAQKAKQSEKPVTISLVSKGVSFGQLVAFADGSLDYSQLDGVDPDLVVKPFGWKGTESRLRRFVEAAARVHFGVQSQHLVTKYKDDPFVDLLGNGSSWQDPDNDGVVHELDDGILTASALYLAMLESPVILPPNHPALRDRWATGQALFEKIGCADCHMSQLPLHFAQWTEMSDTTQKGVSINLLKDGEKPKSTATVQLFSDLKRHDMGELLADHHVSKDPTFSHIGKSTFLTRPLWGIAESGPYLHDGRAPTLADAIIAHGGEAERSQKAFSNLPESDQANVIVFLLSLTRAPKVHVAR